MRLRRYSLVPAVILTLSTGFVSADEPQDEPRTVRWSETERYAGAAAADLWVEGDEGVIDLIVRDDVAPAVAVSYEFIDPGGYERGGGTVCGEAYAIEVPADAYQIRVRPSVTPAGVCTAAATTGTITLTYVRAVEPPVIRSIERSAVARGVSGDELWIEGWNLNPLTAVSVSGSGVRLDVRTVYRDQGPWSTMTVGVSVDDLAETGLRDVIVSNGGEMTATCVGCLSVNPAPTITSVAPAYGRIGRGTAVTIRGTNFEEFSSLDIVPPAGSAAAVAPDIFIGSVRVVDSTTMTANINVQPYAIPGPRTLQVKNPDGGRAACDGCFTVTIL